MKPPIPIAKACPLVQQLFETGGCRSFCEQCQHHVHNLSEMNAEERRSIIKDYRAGKQVCVAYRMNSSGGVILKEEPKKKRVAKMLWALLPLSLASCSTLKKETEVAETGAKLGTIHTDYVAPSEPRTGKEPLGLTGGMPPPPTLWQRFLGIFR